MGPCAPEPLGRGDPDTHRTRHPPPVTPWLASVAQVVVVGVPPVLIEAHFLKLIVTNGNSESDFLKLIVQTVFPVQNVVRIERWIFIVFLRLFLHINPFGRYFFVVISLCIGDVLL